jgi:hypothetical protein
MTRKLRQEGGHVSDTGSYNLLCIEVIGQKENMCHSSGFKTRNFT